MAKPAQEEYPYYFEPYIRKLPYDQLSELVDYFHKRITAFYLSVPEQLGDYRYAEHKWTVKEVFQHLVDTERVFSYRALCLTRQDPAILPSINEEQYVAVSGASERSLLSLKEELLAVRDATNILFRTFNPAQLQKRGFIAGEPASVNGIGFIIFAHLMHHKQILEERYLT